MSVADDRHEVFALEYVRTWSPSKAYKKAYPDAAPSTCRANGHKLLTNPDVRRVVAEYMAGAGMSAEETIARLTKFARGGDNMRTLRALEDIAKANALFQDRVVNEDRRMSWKEFIGTDVDPETTGEQS